MSNQYVTYSILAGLVTFVLCFIIFYAIESPSQYIAGLIVSFLIFEISFHHLFYKDKKKREMM
ncbi:hypothetical protein H0266_15025 [Halobacillus locisalis]|uniref:Uncharacterized protein n=1 Tax=Halobacillus locisalis TaxID=220753 RepID=A0A838CW94_9BACI|nr:hypothetical protein [Halobacillus locisalis]MBA2176208.1 hypothetical protein [Halobacillus locisalis]